MACKYGYVPQDHGRCTYWVGKNGMTSQPTLGQNICDYCVYWQSDKKVKKMRRIKHEYEEIE